LSSKEDSLAMLVYHERKKSNPSGLQTINNLLQHHGVTQKDFHKVTKMADNKDYVNDQAMVRSPRKRQSFRLWSSVERTISKASKGNKDAGNKQSCDASIEVLQKALDPFGVRLLSVADPELYSSDAAHVWGYAVFSGGQWSAVRQVGEHELWVDLDSSLPRPELMSGAEVFRLQLGMPPKSGGLVLAVVGDVPPCPVKGGSQVVRMSVDPGSICTTSFRL